MNILFLSGPVFQSITGSILAMLGDVSSQLLKKILFPKEGQFPIAQAGAGDGA